jgi:hypothetical protein
MRESQCAGRSLPDERWLLLYGDGERAAMRKDKRQTTTVMVRLTDEEYRRRATPVRLEANQSDWLFGTPDDQPSQERTACVCSR